MRALGYIRVSKERADMVSPDIQQDAIARYCESRGYTLLECLSDIDLSGLLPPEKRPGLTEVMSRAQAGDCDVVVVYRIDRLSREPADYYAILRLLKDAGVAVDAASQPRDDTPESGLIWDISAVLARYESLRLGLRLRDMHRHLARSGRWSGGPPPFGLRHGDGGGLVPHEEEAPWVRQAHAWYQSGWGIHRIAREIGIRYRTVDASTVQTMLFSPIIIGGRRHDGEIVIGDNVTPLVEVATWERTQAIRQARSVTHREGRAGNRLLTGGRIVCATCGTRCIAQYERGGRHAYYRCSSHRMGVECERPMWIRIPMLEERVGRAIVRRLQRSPSAQRKPPPRLVDLTGLTAQADRLRESLTRLAVMAAQGEIDRDEHQSARDELRRKLSAVEQQLERAGRNLQEQAMDDARDAFIRAVAGMTQEEWEILPIEHKRAVASILVRLVRIQKQEPRVRVTWTL